jgi:hypothetical protein
MVVVEDTGDLGIQRAPEQVLAEAHRAAAALKRVIDAKPEKILFGPVGKQKQYLTFEDWQTVGRFYGIAPRIVTSRPVTLGMGEATITGWEAVAEAVHVSTGRVVSSADAMCLNDEEKWSARPKYAWVYHKKSGGTSEADPGKDELIWEKGADGKMRPKKERIQAGMESVPQFQLRSMAQTRAGAKALRNALAWVVVLAGYSPTPAEELPEADVVSQRPVAEDAVVVEAPSQTAERLFVHEPQTEARLQAERAVLIKEIKDAALAMAVSDAEKADYQRKYLNGASVAKADPSALQDMLDAIRGRP